MTMVKKKCKKARTEFSVLADFMMKPSMKDREEALKKRIRAQMQSLVFQLEDAVGNEMA